jgi:hypothetical protein
MNANLKVNGKTDEKLTDLVTGKTSIFKPEDAAVQESYKALREIENQILTVPDETECD